MPDKGKVLIIDDDEDLLGLVAMALEREGFTAATAASGEKGVALAGAGDFDLVFLDLMMPGMDGLATLRELRRNCPRTAVIMLTAHGSIETAVESMRLGASDYLKKPFELAALGAAAERAVEKRRLDEIARAAMTGAGGENVARSILSAAARLLAADEALLLMPASPWSPAKTWSLGGGEVWPDASGLCAAARDLLNEAGADCLAADPAATPGLAGLPGADRFRAALFIPLPCEGGECGMIFSGRRAAGRPFGEDDLRKARSFAPVAALAARNSALSDQLGEARVQLARTQKMEALGLMVGQVSHDFNNLLAVIVGSINLVMANLKPSEDPALLKEVLRMSDEAGTLVRQLLLFSRRQEARAAPADPGAALEEIRLMVDRLPGERISTVYDINPAPAVAVTPEKFKQIALNLVINARDSAGADGEVKISLKPASAGGGAVLEVSDNGPGIEPGDAGRIFEPFFSTKAVGRGTGLGLHIVKTIVDEAGGEITVESLPGKGAAFRVTLPPGA
ncbi:MAG: hybrid sensor histidine kinase/response regulator [Elusimicrobiales bacterium]|nr:hybrid sensor histidine kinase/response regulator [Elusimicrobiales bacterium]